VLNSRLKSKGGFTLIELVVVLAVLAALAVIAIPVVTHTVNSAVLEGAKTDANTLKGSFNSAYSDLVVGYSENYNRTLISTQSLTVADVISTNSYQSMCGKRNYYGREFVLVWNFDTNDVELMYDDDNTNVETGAVITNYVIITETSTTLVLNLG
jgi:prepilin-type N-terminal cleavage/methylation domain-containing protein